jgi:hypothetical protein
MPSSRARCLRPWTASGAAPAVVGTGPRRHEARNTAKATIAMRPCRRGRFSVRHLSHRYTAHGLVSILMNVIAQLAGAALEHVGFIDVLGNFEGVESRRRSWLGIQGAGICTLGGKSGRTP